MRVNSCQREKLVEKVPNYLGYEQKGYRKETDKGLREHLASQIEGIKRKLEDLADKLLLDDSSELGKTLNKMSRRMSTVIESLRLTDYEGASFLESDTVDEDSLEKIYNYDLSLKEKLEAIDEEIGALLKGEIEEGQMMESFNRILDQIDSFNQEFSEREFLVYGGKEEI